MIASFVEASDIPNASEDRLIGTLRNFTDRVGLMLLWLCDDFRAQFEAKLSKIAKTT
jgi:hypothetical protein